MSEHFFFKLIKFFFLSETFNSVNCVFVLHIFWSLVSLSLFPISLPVFPTVQERTTLSHQAPLFIFGP